MLSGKGDEDRERRGSPYNASALHVIVSKSTSQSVSSQQNNILSVPYM